MHGGGDGEDGRARGRGRRTTREDEDGERRSNSARGRGRKPARMSYLRLDPARHPHRSLRHPKTPLATRWTQQGVARSKNHRRRVASYRRVVADGPARESAALHHHSSVSVSWAPLFSGTLLYNLLRRGRHNSLRSATPQQPSEQGAAPNSWHTNIGDS